LPFAPAGWRDARDAEVAQKWRSGDPARYLVVRADFNGDHRIDEARLLVREDGNALALVVFIAQADGYKVSILDTIDGSGWLDVIGISLAVPDRYPTACGKGYFECESGEPKELVLLHPAIDCFKEESADSVFYWDDRTGSFRRVWMSD
jgi:hypothetical protein